MMDELDRINLDMALSGLLAEIAHIELRKTELMSEDRAQLRMVMARLNSLLSEKVAA